MDWDGGRRGPNVIGLIFAFLFVALWLGISAIFFDGHVSVREIGLIAVAISGVWAGDEWFQTNKADKRKMREALDLIEQKLDEALKNQERIEQALSRLE